MTDYFRVVDSEIVEGPVARGSIRHPTVSICATTTDAELKALNWLPEIRVDDAAQYNPATQKLTGPVRVVGLESVTSTWSVVSKTAQEQADYADGVDMGAIIDGILDIAEILISHIDAHLAKGNIAASDFVLATRQKYQALKARVDRLR